MQAQIRNRALADATDSAKVVSRLGILPLLTPGDISHGLTPGRLDEIDQQLRTNLLGREVAAVRVWAPGERIVYANQRDLIGRTFQGNDELEEALGGHVVSEIFDPSKAAGADPTIGLYHRFGGLFEVYVPLVFGSDTAPAGAFELYLPYRPIGTVIAHDTRNVYELIGLGLLLLWLILMPIAYRTARRMRDQTAKLTDLLSRERETVQGLREIDRMKSDFVSMASHELRTPLTSILGFVKTLQQPAHGGDAELREEFLGRMERQSDRLLRLVDQLLQAARLQTEGADPKIVSIDFTELVREVGGTVEDRRIQLIADLPKDLSRLWTDRTMVEYILTNLLGNAAKYSRPGGRVTIGARNSFGNFRFWVQDEGPGIEPDQLGRLFEPFWQADTSLTREVGGVGLGLYIVKQFTLALRGDVVVESKLGEGTRFTVLLPNVRTLPSMGLKAAAPSRGLPGMAAYDRERDRVGTSR